jgi:alpha-beta hydrolase superfamily lysophospholipase
VLELGLRRVVRLAAFAIGVALVTAAAVGAAADALPRRGQLGVRVAAVPDDFRPPLKLQAGEGVLVQLVTPGGSAEAGRLQSGDILLTLQGQRIGGVSDFLDRAAALIGGQPCELGLLRNGKRMALRLLVSERPRDRGENFDVLYDEVVSGGSRLRTIVTKPHAAGRHPVLLLIPGLGAGSVDQPLGDGSAYSRILAEFAREGWVTVRVDKPGVGDSEGGPPDETGFEAELDGYRQALRAARRYDFADADAVFVFGHGLGGVFGPMLAGETPVKGVAVYGTMVKPWVEYLIENRRRQEMLAGTDPAVAEARVRDMTAAVRALLIDRTDPGALARARPELQPVLKLLLPDGRHLWGHTLGFWSQLAATNVPASWAKGQAHVLAIWGRNDFIATEADHPQIAEIVNRARSGRGRYVALPGSDHAFRKTTSVEDSFRRWTTPALEIDPEIVTTLKAWTAEVRGSR